METKLFDDLGNTYIAAELTVGNLQSSSGVTQDLISGVPTLAKFKFSNVSPKANSLSLFQPEFIEDGGNGDHFIGDFRNINL